MSAVLFGLACGRTEQDPRAGSGGSAGSSGSGGAITFDAAAPDLASCGFATFPDSSIAKGRTTVAPDVGSCAEREPIECEANQLSEQLQSAWAPHFAECQPYMSYDGCGALLLDFDANGCIESSTMPAGVNDRLPTQLDDLEVCLLNVFGRSRWPCFASKRIAFCESCFIR
ncbi:MAG: hypothetical protein QM756_02525 [Polyangiaceae bacterium]